MTRAVDAMRQLFKVDATNNTLGNAEPKEAIFPKYDGTVVRDTPAGRELLDMHWGFVLPQKSKKTGNPIQPKAVNNARDDKVCTSGFWRESFNERRCLVPASAFCEATGRNPATYHWFTVDDGLFAFAGVWKRHKGFYKDEMVDIETYSFLTCAPSDYFSKYHDRMPVALDPGDYDQWMNGTPDEAFALIRPIAKDRLHLIGEGEGMRREPSAPTPAN